MAMPQEAEEKKEEVEENKEESTKADKATELKVVIIVKGNKMLLGVQSPDCDPVYTTLEGTLNVALKRLPKLIEEAKQKWDAHPRYPDADLPAPEPEPTRATRSVSAPKEKPKQPSFF